MTFKIETQEDKGSVIAYINSLPQGKKYTVDITLDKRVRTIPQNKLYRLWLNCIAHETGNDTDYLHSFFATRYLGTENVEVFGQIQSKPISTTKLTTAQFTEYLELIQAFAAEQGIVLPQPTDLYFKDFMNQYGRF